MAPSSEWASSASRTKTASRSGSAYTATLPMPASLQARITRTAISPRLAISTFCSGLTSARFSGTTLLGAAGNPPGRLLRRDPPPDRSRYVRSSLPPMTTRAPRSGGLPFDPIDEAARQWARALGGRPADARGHLADAGAAAGARPARRPAQAAGPDLRPLRGAGAAPFSSPARCRWARWGSGCRCTPPRSPRSSTRLESGGLRRTTPHPAGRPRRAGRDHRRRPRAGRGGHRRPGRRRLRARRARRRPAAGELSALLRPIRQAAGDF